MNACSEGLCGAKILSRASLNLLSLLAALTSNSPGEQGSGNAYVGVRVKRGVNKISVFAMQNSIEKPRETAHTSPAHVFA